MASGKAENHGVLRRYRTGRVGDLRKWGELLSINVPLYFIHTGALIPGSPGFSKLYSLFLTGALSTQAWRPFWNSSSWRPHPEAAILSFHDSARFVLNTQLFKTQQHLVRYTQLPRETDPDRETGGGQESPTHAWCHRISSQQTSFRTPVAS